MKGGKEKENKLEITCDPKRLKYSPLGQIQKSLLSCGIKDEEC